MINSLQGRPVYSLDLLPNTSQQSAESLGVGKTHSHSKQLYTTADSQLMIVNNKITSSVETIVNFICQLHNMAQHNEQNLHNFELKLTDQKISEQLSKLTINCTNGLLKAEDVGTGNYSLLVGYYLSKSVLNNITPFSDYISKFHEMNKLCVEVFLKLGPSFDLLIPEIREKSQEFYKIKDALDLSWGFAEIKDSILQLVNMQSQLQADLTKQLQTVVEYDTLLDSGLQKLMAESNRFVVRKDNPLYIQRAKELSEEIEFLTTHSKSIRQGLQVYDDTLNFLVRCQLQLRALCDSIDELETYYPLLLKSELNEAGY